MIAAIVLAATIDPLFSKYENSPAGASVIVIRKGEVVFRKAYGTTAKPETNYRLASVTKQFTAAAILQLRVPLDERITRYLPEFPEHGITVRQLLTHTSGLVDYEDVIPAGTMIPLKDFDVLWMLQQQPKTLFEPGTKWQYSNSGYALLALIVEKVSGQTFAAYLRDHLFKPAGMKNTVAYEKGMSVVPNRAYGQPEDQSLTSAVLGDGGIYSSVDDLARWYKWLDKQPFYREATKPHAKTPDASYGYGWFVRDNEVWHTGETIGFRNAVLRTRDLTVIILTNRNEGHPIEIAREIAARH